MVELLLVTAHRKDSYIILAAEQEVRLLLVTTYRAGTDYGPIDCRKGSRATAYSAGVIFLLAAEQK
jgi:hypothetical protein